MNSDCALSVAVSLISWLMYHTVNYRPTMKFGKVMLSQVSVTLSVGGGDGAVHFQDHTYL